MCGIFGYVGPRTDGATIVLAGLKQLEYRGYDSWGVAVASPDKIVVKKKTGKIGEANVKDMPHSSFAFGHTRWATHGGVSEVNAHPHLDCTGTIAIIHNGILENYEVLKQKLLTKNHRFVSQTDTEVAVHLIEEYAKRMLFSKAVQQAFNDMEGLNAFIAMNRNNNQFVAVRSGSPLVVGFGNGENFLASDAAALLPYTRQVHFLEDDEMALVSAAGVMMFNARTGVRIKPQKQTLTWSVAEVEKGSYPFFMLKEIHEQPGVMADIAADNAEHAVKLAGIIRQSHGAYMVGCGTAAYACLAGSYLFSKIARRHVNWAIGSEFGYQLDFLTDKSLILALSQSGETMDLLDSVRKSKEKKAKIAALVNVLGSSLWRIADYTLVIGAGPEKGVASTKAFIGKLAHLTLLAYALDGRIREGQKVVTMAVKSAKTVLGEPTVSHIQKLAKKIKKARHVYVIGRGLSYPAALEIALKIKEISYIHAEGLAAGELKHGPLALVEKGTPCIALLPDDETYGANLAGAMEMKARGGYIIGISHKPHEVFDYYVPIADAREATIIPMVIAGQLLAYYLTIARGFDPDKPRNLAKSVTVK
ncbi:glutamine--fructose-6-phosphate transaminase (isomerizing) [Candidatus Gottesmanbacteria bacterium]|nr:glutamine--fructose-6-phosphate transaminase (isomerizing) [Candidatus Gottesmanbacteria bacterium]